MWPEELKAIIDGLEDLPTDQGFLRGSTPFIFQEVIDLGMDLIKLEEKVGSGLHCITIYRW
jgi:hypothetical protein